MKLTLRERYGIPLAFLLLVWLLRVGVSDALYREEAFAMLFPLNWLSFLPFDIPVRFYEGEGWVLLLEIIVSALAWMAAFFAARGAYYLCTNLEGPSMWLVFLLCIAAGFVLILIVLLPALRQMDIWWEAWPGRAPSVLGGLEVPGLPEVETVL